jgi:hypothetical protein
MRKVVLPGEYMHIPDRLVEDIKDYLNRQSEQGSLEAKLLLEQLERVPPQVGDLVALVSPEEVLGC